MRRATRIYRRTRRSRVGRTIADTDTGAEVIIALIVTVIGLVIFFVMLERSYDTTTFVVTHREWSTTSQLYHTETDTVCGWEYDSDGESSYECKTTTDTVVDKEVRHSGVNTDPIEYHTFTNYGWDQSVRLYFYSNVRVIDNTTEKTIDYNPDQAGYMKTVLGAYCYGEIGWFNLIRNVDCSGR